MIFILALNKKINKSNNIFHFQIASETSVAHAKANSSLTEVQDLERRVDEVKLQYKINQQHLEDTTNAVNQAALKAQRAANDAKQLEDVSTALLLLLRH